MARIETDPNYTTPTFSRATAATDPFKKEDVQQVAAALSVHDHSSGKGLKIGTAGIQAPLTLTMASSGSGANQGTLNLVDTTGSANLVLVANNGLSKAIRCTNVGGGTLEVINAANSAVLFSLDNNGAMQFPGPLAITNAINCGTINASGSVTAAGGLISTNGVVYFGSSQPYLQAVNPTTIQTSGALTVNGAFVQGGATATFGSGGGTVTMQGALTVSAAITTTAGGDITASGNFRGQSGGLYLGSANQSFLQMWNPGEFRVSSSPGNLYALGVMTAEGGPVTGKGAYINSASSVTVKTNIVELDPTACMGQVIDPRMRPVTFQYIDPLPPMTALVDLGTKDVADATPDDAKPVEWTQDRLGFIAEEVMLVVPEAVGVIEGSTVAHGLVTEALIPILWGAVRALDARVKTLEAA